MKQSVRVFVAVLFLLPTLARPAYSQFDEPDPANDSSVKNAQKTTSKTTDDTTEETTEKTSDKSPDLDEVFGDPPGAVRLDKTGRVWFHPKRKLVIVDGKVTLREGQLEMFACTKGTKEHESIVAVDGKAQHVHTGLILAGAKEGNTVKFDPKYTPATGDVIDIFILWQDAKGKKKKTRAQQWIKHAKTGEAMSYEWVFAGSSFWKDTTDGKEYYQGDTGDFICVSNFPTATLDLPVQSSQTNDDLLFTAFTDRIPPRGTPVRLVLIPRKGNMPPPAPSP